MGNTTHANVKLQPPFGNIAEVTSKILHTHTSESGLAELPHSPLLTIANSQPMGHFVAFTLHDLAVSEVTGFEDELRSLRNKLRIGRLGCLLVTATIDREYCGDDLAHYKHACNAQLLVSLPDTPPKSGLLPGTMRLFNKEDTDFFVHIHELLNDI